MKNVKFIYLILLILIFFPIEVFAADEVNHIVNIENFSVDDEQNIGISGYAYFSHQDNVGYFKLNDKSIGNLKTYIVAYIGDWEQDFAKYDKCMNSENCYSVEADSGVYRYIKDNGSFNSNANRSMWAARCTNATCDGLNQNLKHRENLDIEFDPNSEDSYSISKYNGNEEYYNSTSCNNSTPNKIGRQCLYENVGFSIEIPLLEVVAKFSKGATRYDGTIKFKVVSVNIPNSEKAGERRTFCIDSDNGGTFSCIYATDDSNLSAAYGVSDLAVSSGVCFSSDNSKCTYNNSEKVYEAFSGRYKIKLTDLDPQVYFDAVAARVRDEEGKHLSPIRYFENKKYYDVYDFKKTINMTKTTPTGGKLEYTDSLIRLGATSSGSSDYVKPKDNDSESIDGSDYWAAATYVVFKGSVKITSVEPEYEELSCNDLLYEIRPDSKFNVTNNEDVKCGDEDVQFWQCKGDKADGTEFLSEGTLYVKNTNNSYSDYLNIRYGENFLPVKVEAKVILNQLGGFGFDEISNKSISAGKSFGFSHTFDAGVQDGIDYNRRISPLHYNFYIEWANRDWYIQSNASGVVEKIYPYYVFSSADHNSTYFYAQDENGYWNIPIYLNIETFMKDASEYYYNDIYGNKVIVNNLDEALFGVIDVATQQKYYGSNFGRIKTLSRSKFNQMDSSNEIIKSIESYFNEVMSVESYDSNSISKIYLDDEIVPVLGNWDLIDANDSVINVEIKKTDAVTNQSLSTGIKKNVGRRSWYAFSYELPNAYISKYDNNFYNGSEFNANNILYTNNTDVDETKFYSVGKKYFVGFNYLHDNALGYDFPFNLSKDANPSIVSGMMWQLNATCGVEVEPGLIPGPGDSNTLYKYRSISLSNPFPKAEVDSFGKLKNVATNWIDWYNEASDNNFSRFINTYDNGVKYSIVLSKNSNTDDTKISDVNSFKIYYGSVDEISDDGQSDFVNGYNRYRDIIKFNIKETLNPDRLGFCKKGYFSSECDKYAKTNIGLH